ncbi:MAG TPA: hypothetical protein VKM55_07390 [Candidatus Lokiarchaeia archaeon]|nr:hypothetical protein [Candidatus Lokiarchaeia archaeon]
MPIPRAPNHVATWNLIKQRLVGSFEEHERFLGVGRRVLSRGQKTGPIILY